MRELLHLRLGPVSAIAVLGAVGFLILRWWLSALERSGRIPVLTDPSKRSLRTDLAYVLLSPITEVLSRTLSTFVVVGCAVLAGRHVGPGLLDGFGPVVTQPRWAIIIEMLVLSDFIYYWVHRFAHTVPALWRLHAVHHSTRHLRWTSALRAHPAEVYLHLVTVLPLFMLGFPVDALAPLAPLVTLYALLIHTNVKVTLRPVSYFVNTPMYHGWHHALDAKDGGVNFAGFFPLFDAIFGTYRLPQALPPAVGIDDVEMPDTCVEQLKYPFRPFHGGSQEALGADAAFSRQSAAPEAAPREVPASAFLARL